MSLLFHNFNFSTVENQSGEQAAILKGMGFKMLNMYTGTVSLVPDSLNPDSPLSKKMVREALSYAINREAIAKARGFGY